MAAGQSFEPDRTGNQSALNQSLSQPNEGHTQAVRTALWAVGVTILSNVANILKQLKDVAESVVQLQQFVEDHPWVSGVLLSVVLIWGNVLLFQFLYRRLKRRIPTAYKVLVSAGCVVLVSGVFVSNVFSLKNLLQSPVQIQGELVSELETTQDAYGGAFRNAATPEGVPDAWTTAQALKAVLLTKTYDPTRARQGFSYIESERRNDGFEVYVGTDTKPFIRTEIAAWVALAYLESLSKSGFWAESERNTTIVRIEDTLQIIGSQQDRASGGWSPVPHTTAHERTYATMMSVWALTEALLSKDIPSRTKQGLGSSLEAGVAWLITRYQDNLGWEEDPQHRLGKSFPGLTYQVLFVLERAQLVSGHNSFKNAEAYRRIKRELRTIVHMADIGDLTSVPTSYIMVGEYPCWADVLSYPWLLSVLPTLVVDPDVSTEDRRYLRGLLRSETAKIPELPSKLLRTETWQVAEDLIGVSTFISSRQLKE
jgi:hypothetical protein